MAATEKPGGDAHPNDDLLLALHDDVLFSGDRPGVERHVKSCAKCQARLTALTEDISIDAAPEPTRTTRAPRIESPASSGSPYRSVLRRLAIVVVLFGVLGTAGIVGQRELNRRNAEPVSLAPTPPVPSRAPAPSISNISPPAAPATSSPTAATAPAVEPLVISSPNNNFRWRVVGLEVERTNNGGTDWRPQMVKLTKAIAGGAAPSAAVCWLVGKGGTVFVAMGSDWKDVSLTEKVDLTGVTAIDAMNATVTAVDRRQFSTSDAGVTWTAQPQ